MKGVQSSRSNWTTESSPYDSQPTSRYSNQSLGPSSDLSTPTVPETPPIPSSDTPEEEDSVPEDSSGSRSRSERRGHSRPSTVPESALEDSSGSRSRSERRGHSKPRSVPETGPAVREVPHRSDQERPRRRQRVAALRRANLDCKTIQFHQN